MYRGVGFTHEPPPPALWLQGVAALAGLVLIIIGGCFEYWHSPAAAFIAMGAGYFLANFLIALSQPLSFSNKMTLILAMHFFPFCLVLAYSINGLLPLIILTFTCSLAGMAMASKLAKTGQGGAKPRSV